jgi:cellobiose phosphorylase
MYRLLVESLLGRRREGDMLWLEPCIPADCPQYVVTDRDHSSRYRNVVRASPTPALRIDGVQVSDACIALHDDGATHEVELDVDIDIKSSRRE